MLKFVGTMLVAGGLLLGCDAPREDQAAGGGGGKVVAAGPNVDVQAARNRLGEAYVHAARTHADVVRGDYDGAIGALRDARKELQQAKQTARLDTQTRINEMDQAAIRVMREIEARSLTSYQATERFVGQVQGLLASMPPQAVPGGGGGQAPMGEPAPGSSVMPAPMLP